MLALARLSWCEAANSAEGSMRMRSTRGSFAAAIKNQRQPPSRKELCPDGLQQLVLGAERCASICLPFPRERGRGLEGGLTACRYVLALALCD